MHTEFRGWYCKHIARIEHWTAFDLSKTILFRFKVKWIHSAGEDNERISIVGYETGATNLTIEGVIQDDAGIYTCRKSDTLEHVYLNVIRESGIP